MPTNNPETQRNHQEMKPFQPWFSRPTQRQQTTLYAVVFFFFTFFGTLSIRAVWELRGVGYPVVGLILWAVAVAAGLTIMPTARAHAKFKSRSKSN